MNGVVLDSFTVTARATASSRSFSTDEARNDFQSGIVSAIAEAEAGLSATITVDLAVNAFAEAIARAFVEASVSIESNSPTATACASVQVSSEASAAATASALIDVRSWHSSVSRSLSCTFSQALAEATSPTVFTSTTEAVSAVESVTVRAFAAANINACVSGVGQVEAMVTQLAEVIASVSTEVTTAVIATVTPGSGVATIDVGSSTDGAAPGDSILTVTTVTGTSTSETSGPNGKLVFIHE